MTLRPRHGPVFVDGAQYRALLAIRTQRGIPISEQVRRAVREWITKHPAEEKPA